MKKITIIGSFTLSFFLMNCGGSNESAAIVTEEDKKEIMELEEKTKEMEEKRAKIDASRKELEALLEDL